MKLYLLFSYDAKEALPILTEDFVLNVMKVLCEKGVVKEAGKGRNLEQETMELQKKLSCFYTEHYQRTMAFDEEDLGFTNKDQILKYVARKCGQGLREQH